MAAAEKELKSEDCHHVAILLAGPPLEAEPVEVLLTGSLLNPPTVFGPLVRMATDPELDRLHRRVTDAIQKLLEHCKHGDDDADRNEEPHSDGPKQERLAIGSGATAEERDITRECPSCGGNKPLAWDVCGDCRLKQYTARVS